jgi:hypothetical protein
MKEKNGLLAIRGIILYKKTSTGFVGSLKQFILKDKRTNLSISKVSYGQKQKKLNHTEYFSIKTIIAQDKKINMKISNIYLDNKEVYKNSKYNLSSSFTIGGVIYKEAKQKIVLKNLRLGTQFANLFISKKAIEKIKMLIEDPDSAENMTKKDEEFLQDALVKLLRNGMSFRTSLWIDDLYASKELRLHAPLKINITVDLKRNKFTKKMLNATSDEIQQYFMNYLVLKAHVKLAKKDLELIKGMLMQSGGDPMIVGILGMAKTKGKMAIFDFRASKKSIKLNGMDLLPKQQR